MKEESKSQNQRLKLEEGKKIRDNLKGEAKLLNQIKDSKLE